MIDVKSLTVMGVNRAAVLAKAQELLAGTRYDSHIVEVTEHRTAVTAPRQAVGPSNAAIPEYNWGIGTHLWVLHAFYE